MKKNLPTSASPPSISSIVNTSAAACNSRGDAVAAGAAEAPEAAQAVEVVPDAEAAAAASVAEDVAAAAGAGSMPSGSAISRPPAADPGEGAAIAKSHDLTARLSRGPVQLGARHRQQHEEAGLTSSVHFRSIKTALLGLNPLANCSPSLRPASLRSLAK